MTIILLAFIRPLPQATRPALLPPVVLIRPASLDEALDISLRCGFRAVDWTVVR